MDTFAQMVQKIIQAQEEIIGPVAIEQARKVWGLTYNPQNNEVSFTGDRKSVLDNLVKQYEQLFGRASIEVCKEAIKNIATGIPKEQLPASLQ